MLRQRVSAGSPWGERIGYSRAIRAGDTIVVSGTTASSPDGGALHADDAAAQTRVVLERIEAALHELGAELRDVAETRVFVTDLAHVEAVGRVHGEIFREIKPATTLLEVPRLIAPGLLVEDLGSRRHRDAVNARDDR